MGKMLNKEHQHLFGLESSVSSSEQGFLQLFTSSSQKNLQIFQQFAECGMEELITLIVRNFNVPAGGTETDQIYLHVNHKIAGGLYLTRLKMEL
jgi:hypothetical protein